MSEQKQRQGPPLGFFVFVAGIVALGVYIMLTTERITEEGGGVLQEDAAVPMVLSRDVTFVKREDFSLDVYDVNTGALIENVVAKRDPFLQSVIDKYGRDRKKQGVGPEEPYRLMLMADGRVSFVDLRTDNKIHDVRNFGTGNSKPFFRILGVEPGFD